MILSVVIPAHNEEKNLPQTVKALYEKLHSLHISHEIRVVNDHSADSTEDVLMQLSKEVPTLRVINNQRPGGFGYAVASGIETAEGDCIAIYMADASDTPEDLVSFYHTMKDKNVDCVFGTRFSKKSKLVDYPLPKLILNRLANLLIQIIFGLRYNDVTNAFKLYKKEALVGLKPYLSQHFNLTVELPLKAIVRGYSYEVVPNSWINRTHGVSKFKIKEMGSRYLFILVYCFIEKWLSRGDYKKK